MQQQGMQQQGMQQQGMCSAMSMNQAGQVAGLVQTMQHHLPYQPPATMAQQPADNDQQKSFDHGEITNYTKDVDMIRRLYEHAQRVIGKRCVIEWFEKYCKVSDSLFPITRPVPRP